MNKSKIWFKGLMGFGAFSIVTTASLTVVSCQTIDYNDGYFDRPVNWYSPFNSKTGSSDAFANDACSILWDEEQQLFYSWMLFRDGKGFPSGWIEMTSPDLNTWKQGKYRIQQGSEFENLDDPSYSTSALGGSVWVDTKGQFFEKGDIVFVISMQPSRILNKNGSEEIKSTNTEMNRSIIKNEYTTEESGIAYFVSHGLGQDFYTSGILSKECLNEDGTFDWRDTAVFETEDGVYFAISAHDRLEFYRINNFGNKPEDEGTEKITKVSELFVRNIGVEVPNVARVDENLWYVSASVQDNPFGGPFQSAWWTLCEWDAKTGFIPVYKDNSGKYVKYDLDKLQTREAAYAVQKEQPNAKVIDWSKSKKYKDLINPWTPNEYGTEGYAQRVVNPYQTQLQEAIDEKDDKKIKEYNNFLIARSMTSNWAYNTDIWSWKGGLYGSEKITWNEEHTDLVFMPNDKIAGYSDNGTAVYNLKGSDLLEGYTLKFDGKNFTFYLELDKNEENGKVVWNNQLVTGLKKWTNQGGPTDKDDEIIIVWNKSTLTFYNKTKNWNAHFMLPQGTKHTINEGAKSIV
ncbi:hypothetical protein mflW37_4780 [Mesoplasma florum W37]|uniref:Glycosyl hydrolase family 32 N-terminal domain-containing protein n=1 Tax=Mesoplasma florum TaxID=2151 RepID=A0AAD0HS43_MESFO|nr:hypothetical protein [Mesoplasma florum]AGY41545.1 hypothetical protein mflW37_4780 [Mesoplasma florum W37]AVN59753.1 hypothetical protein CG008_02495 [Mesoplasma florum]AVN65885.1 hypothetical protein MflW12_4800 [Mesoplasma florum]